MQWWHLRERAGEPPSDGLVVPRRIGAGMLGFSVFLVPEGKVSNPGLLQVVAAAAASEGIRKDTGVISWLLWPDGITIGGELVARAPVRRGGGEQAGSLSVDFLVNSHTPRREGETSLLEVLGVMVDPRLLREKVLESLSWYYSEWQRGMYAKLAERVRPTLWMLGKDVEVGLKTGARVRGRVVDITVEGALVVDGEGGASTLRPGAVERVTLR